MNARDTEESHVQQERLSYPTERVVGIADDRQTVESALAALSEAGIEDDRVEVLTSESEGVTEEPGEGIAGRITHVLKTAIGDETERLQGLHDALEAGRFIVQVRLGEDDDDDRERTKREVGRLLSRQGLGDVAFYGKWQIEEIQLGA